VRGEELERAGYLQVAGAVVFDHDFPEMTLEQGAALFGIRFGGLQQVPNVVLDHRGVGENAGVRLELLEHPDLSP
jgi:hypothetical protein